MNSLQRRRIARSLGDRAQIHLDIADGPDDRDEFAADEAPCCMASAVRGPRACTCWTPVYDLDQAAPNLSTQPQTRASCCHDCAYRNDSPERADLDLGEELVDIAGSADSVFACHQGMRRVVAYRHPDGREIPAGPGDYHPPMVGQVAFRADGTPADWCAGWAAHRRYLLGPGS